MDIIPRIDVIAFLFPLLPSFVVMSDWMFTHKLIPIIWLLNKLILTQPFPSYLHEKEKFPMGRSHDSSFFSFSSIHPVPSIYLPMIPLFLLSPFPLAIPLFPHVPFSLSLPHCASRVSINEGSFPPLLFPWFMLHCLLYSIHAFPLISKSMGRRRRRRGVLSLSSFSFTIHPSEQRVYRKESLFTVCCEVRILLLLLLHFSPSVCTLFSSFHQFPPLLLFSSLIPSIPFYLHLQISWLRHLQWSGKSWLLLKRKNLRWELLIDGPLCSR